MADLGTVSTFGANRGLMMISVKLREGATWPSITLTAIMLTAWVGWIGAAKGFWSTLAAVLIAPYAWVVFAEFMMSGCG